MLAQPQFPNKLSANECVNKLVKTCGSELLRLLSVEEVALTDFCDRELFEREAMEGLYL